MILSGDVCMCVCVCVQNACVCVFVTHPGQELQPQTGAIRAACVGGGAGGDYRAAWQTDVSLMWSQAGRPSRLPPTSATPCRHLALKRVNVRLDHVLENRAMDYVLGKTKA